MNWALKTGSGTISASAGRRRSGPAEKRFHINLRYPLNRVFSDVQRERNPFKKLRMIAGRLGKVLSSMYAVVFLPERPPMPIRLQVENTNRCNLKCIMCGRAFIDLCNKDLPHEDFLRLLHDVRPAYLTLNGNGEPLLDARLEEKLVEAKRIGCIVSMPSNMTLAKADRVEKIVRTGVDLITISFDGATKKTYESIRVGATFEAVIENIKALTAAAKRQIEPSPPEIRVLFVLQDQNMNDYEACTALQRELGLSVQLTAVKYRSHEEIAERCAHTPERQVELEQNINALLEGNLSTEDRDLLARWMAVAKTINSPQRAGRVCLKPWTTAYIDARGDVYPCCIAVDRDASLKLGNIHAQSFRDIWHSARYVDYRHMMIESRGKVPVCRDCPAEDAGLRRRALRWIGWLPTPLKRAWMQQSCARNG